MADILTQTFIPFSVVGFGDIIDIPEGTSGTIDAISVHAMTDMICGVNIRVAVSAEDGCFFSDINETPVVTPCKSESLRDHLNMNLRMVRGDTISFNISIVLNGLPVDITNGVLRMTAKWSVTDEDADAIFTKTSTPVDGIVITDAVNGLATITLSPADTINLPDHTVTVPYDVQLDILGAIFTVLLGNLTILVDVSNQTP